MMATGEYFFVITIRFTAKQVGAAMSSTISTDGTMRTDGTETRHDLFKKAVDICTAIFEQTFQKPAPPDPPMIMFFSLAPN